MLETLGAEILALIAKEVAKQSPAIAEAIIADLGHIGTILYKYMYDEVESDVEKLEGDK